MLSRSRFTEEELISRAIGLIWPASVDSLLLFYKTFANNQPKKALSSLLRLFTSTWSLIAKGRCKLPEVVGSRYAPHDVTDTSTTVQVRSSSEALELLMEDAARMWDADASMSARAPSERLRAETPPIDDADALPDLLSARAVELTEMAEKVCRYMYWGVYA